MTASRAPADRLPGRWDAERIGSFLGPDVGRPSPMVLVPRLLRERGPLTLEAIRRGTGLSVYDVQSAVFRLQRAGTVVKAGTGARTVNTNGNRHPALYALAEEAT